jgi:hypothetical protein
MLRPASPPHIHSPSQLIRDIRAAHGFDNEQPTPAVIELRGKLERALDR